MTNCVYTRHQGKKTAQDVSYCLKTLQNITKDEWLRMCDVHGAKLGVIEEDEKEKNTIDIIESPIKAKVKAKAKAPKKTIVIPSLEELRKLRTTFYT